MMTNMTMMTSTTNISKDSLPDHVHIFSVEDHDYWKPRLLEAIERMKIDNNIQLNEKGYYYDFNIPDVKRTYDSLIDNIILPHVSELQELYGLKKPKKSQSWFQQYIQGSDFGWHQHNGHWAMVYYIELPEKNESTEFLNYGHFDVKEGDILFFPTFLVHRSPKIKSNLRKTIISTNLNFTVNREFIEQHDEQYFRN